MSKRKGTPPQHDPKPVPPAGPTAEGYPVLCLRHLQNGWGIDELKPSQCQEFLRKWHKRTQLTWTDLVQHPKHGLGSEFLAKRMFPKVSEWLERDRYMVFRHEANLPFVGFRTGDVFHVLWIEARYNDLYDH